MDATVLFHQGNSNSKIMQTFTLRNQFIVIKQGRVNTLHYVASREWTLRLYCDWIQADCSCCPPQASNFSQPSVGSWYFMYKRKFSFEMSLRCSLINNSTISPFFCRGTVCIWHPSGEHAAALSASSKQLNFFFFALADCMVAVICGSLSWL